MPESYTYRFYLHNERGHFIACIIQAASKRHAAALVEEKCKFVVRNLHAFSRQGTQKSWPNGTLVINKLVTIF